MEIRHYLTREGADPFRIWLDGLEDVSTKALILRRVDRMALGNFADHKFCRSGVWEARIDYGPGYRIYYAQAGRSLVILLCAGSKRSQSRDIDRAIEYWMDFKARRK